MAEAADGENEIKKIRQRKYGKILVDRQGHKILAKRINVFHDHITNNAILTITLNYKKKVEFDSKKIPLTAKMVIKSLKSGLDKDLYLKVSGNERLIAVNFNHETIKFNELLKELAKVKITP